MAGRNCSSVVIIYAFRISVSLIHSLLLYQECRTALQFLASYGLAFVCKFLIFFFSFCLQQLGFLCGLMNKCLNHAGFPAPKLGLYFTCANAIFFIHPSISETGCFSYKGEQANFSISWIWMLSPI